MPRDTKNQYSKLKGVFFHIKRFRTPDIVMLDVPTLITQKKDFTLY